MLPARVWRELEGTSSVPSPKLVWLAGAAAAGTAALILVQVTGDAFVRIDARDPDQVQLGGQLYAAHCASCHGKDLEGQANWQERKPDGRLPAPPHDASGHTWHHPDDMLLGITKEGLGPFAPAGYESDMPAFKEVLNDIEIAAVLAFIKSHWPEGIQRRQTEATDRSRSQ